MKTIPPGFINYIVSPLFEVFSEVINYVLDRKDETDPWHLNLHTNKAGWNEKILAGEVELSQSGAGQDVFPPPVSLAKAENGGGERKQDVVNGGAGGSGGGHCWWWRWWYQSCEERDEWKDWSHNQTNLGTNTRVICIQHIYIL